MCMVPLSKLFPSSSSPKRLCTHHLLHMKIYSATEPIIPIEWSNSVLELGKCRQSLAPQTMNPILTYSSTDVTGPSSAKTAILFIYDIFGYFRQTLQGADILTTSDQYRHYQVFMPDFFEGNPADISWYPPVTEEQKKALGARFPSRVPQTGVDKIPKLLKDIEKTYGPKTWAVAGVPPPLFPPLLEKYTILTNISSFVGAAK